MSKPASNRRTGSSRTSSRQAGGGSSRTSSNSRMWSQPATARQIAALKANGNFDGKFYSKGRAGQTIGESVRGAGPVSSTRTSRSSGTQAGLGQRSTPWQSAAPVAGPAPTRPQQSAPLRAEVVSGPGAAPHMPMAVPQSTGRSEVPASPMFALFDDLEEQHLRRYQAEHSSSWGDLLRNEMKQWATLRTELAKRLMSAHSQLLEVLRDAPPHTVADPAATAKELLASAFPAGYEEQHLRRYLSEHSSSFGGFLRDEVRAWVELRIELAVSNARELVEILSRQDPPALPALPSVAPDARKRHSPPSTSSARTPASPPRPLHGNIPSAGPSEMGQVYVGTVAHINDHGAVVSLDTGERGWLHVSQLRALNGGRRVTSVGDYLEIGQRLRTHGIGMTERGQVQLALVSEDPTATDTDAADLPTESANTTSSQTGSALPGRSRAGRSAGERP